MNDFLDASILVAAFYAEHEHHDASFALLLRQRNGSGCTAAHCLPEVYSVLTGMPGKNRATPDEALLFLGDVRDLLTVVTVSDAEYFGAVEDAAALKITGGGIYDAIGALCAMKAGVKAIYTWNGEDFSRLGAGVAALVRRPDAGGVG